MGETSAVTTMTTPDEQTTAATTTDPGAPASERTPMAKTASLLATVRRAWAAGDSAFQYTMLGILGIAILGAIIVPLTMPEPVPVPSKAEQLAERYLATLPADADKPALTKVVDTYGSDGGEACTASTAATYKSLLTPTKTASGKAGSKLDRAGLASTTQMMATYCPKQGEALDAHATKRANALKRKRAAAVAAAAAA